MRTERKEATPDEAISAVTTSNLGPKLQKATTCFRAPAATQALTSAQQFVQDLPYRLNSTPTLLANSQEYRQFCGQIVSKVSDWDGIANELTTTENIKEDVMLVKVKDLLDDFLFLAQSKFLSSDMEESPIDELRKKIDGLDQSIAAATAKNQNIFHNNSTGHQHNHTGNGSQNTNSGQGQFFDFSGSSGPVSGFSFGNLSGSNRSES